MKDDNIKKELSEEYVKMEIEESMELAKKLMLLDRPTRKKLEILLDGIKIGRDSID